MSLQRSATRRVAGGAAPVRQKKGYEVVQQGVKQLYPELDSTKSTDIDIVFVPGLGAHPEESWKSTKTDFNWASDKDGVARDFPTARVLLYMYESAWTGPLKVKQFISNLALTLLHGLHEKRASGSSRPIVFIGHSMGGLVIAKAVCLAESRQDLFPNLFEDIAGCAVFGTPFHGAEAASVAAMLSHVGQMFDQTVPSKLLDLMKPDDEGLSELRDEFVRMVTKISPNIALCGFYEEQPTNISDLSGVPAFIKALQIPLPKKIAEFVTKESAILGGLMTPMGLACNHRDLVKFESFKDERYSLVRNPLKKIIHGAHLVAKGRRQSTRKVDKTLVTKVMEALDGAQVSRKRRAIARTTTPSSWVLGELESIGWLGKPEGEHQPAPKREDCVWIRGPDGRGKTSASLAALEKIDQMVEAGPASAPILLAYFFCDGSPDYGTAEEVLKSLVQQLIVKHEALATHAKFLLRKKGKEDFKGQPQLTVENLWQALQDMLADDSLFGSKVYFVINNLQVLSQESDSTNTFLDLLKFEIQSMNDSGRHAVVRWLITSGESYGIGQALRGDSVRLIDLEDEKYGDQVQLELRKHAHKKVTDLVAQKNYSKALAYFASSILGRRAQNTQWIDITCVQLEELPQNENDLQVRRLLEAVPQELEALLNHAWRQVFELNRNKVDEIKEMLRVLVLTYEDPTEEELALLVGLYSTEKQRAELRSLVESCRPLLILKTTRFDTKVCFIEGVVRTHLLANAHGLLGLSEEDTKLQHGMLGLRAFTHIMETLNFPVVEIPEDENLEVENDGQYNENYVEPEYDAGNEQADTEPNHDEEVERPESIVNLPDEDEEDDDESDDGYSGYEDDEEEEDEDPEANIIRDKALAYPVKHWLHHASKATTEIAEDLSLENDFWEKGSIIRRRWLTEFVRLTGSFRYYKRSEFSGLHVASAVGFRQLVASLMKNGHEEEKNLRDTDFFTPLHFAASFGRLNIVDELLSKGAPINDGIENGTMTPLHMAAAEGNVKVMVKLLERGADPNASCGAYGAVINAAIQSGNCDAVRILVEKNVSLATEEEATEANETEESTAEQQDDQQDGGTDEDENNGEDDEDGDGEEEEVEEVIKSPLALAALRSDLTMFEFLVKNYSDRLPAKEFNIALIKAAEGGRMEVFKQLLSSYSHPQETFQDALDGAAYQGNWDIVALLLEKCPGLNCDEAFVSTSMGVDGDQEIQTLEAMWEYSRGTITQAKLDESLYEATDLESPRTVELLLRFGASADATGPDYGNALTAAAYDGTMDLAKMLLDAGANINAPEGWALQAAAGEGHIEVVQFLLDSGADVNAVASHDSMPQGTALQAAVEAGNYDIVELLLQHHANPDLGAGELTCPVIAAARKGEEAILEALLAAKVNVDVLGGPDMSTPLINAATYLPQSSIRAILDAGADINLADSDGDTALMMAACVGDYESVQTLLDHGADVLLRNRFEQNALQRALTSGSDESIRILADHVSLILEALRVSIASGDAAVAAVVRSVETRNQGLNYDETSAPVHYQENSATSTQGTHHPVSQSVDEKMAVQPLPSQEPTQPGFQNGAPQQVSSPGNNLPMPNGHSEDLEASIRRIMHAPTWASDTSNQDYATYDSRYSDVTVPATPVVPNVAEKEPARLSGPNTPSPAPEVSMQPNGEYRTATPVSGPIRRKPAPVPVQAYAQNGSSGSTVAELPEQGTRQSQPQVPAALQPRLSQQPSIPYMQDVPSYQNSHPYGATPQHQNESQTRYVDPAVAQSRQYQAYQAYQPTSQPSPPPQQYHQQQPQQQQQQQQQQRASFGRDGMAQQPYRQSVPAAPQHVPYSPPVDSQRRSSNPNQPNQHPLHRPPLRPQQQAPNSFNGTAQMHNGVKYAYDHNGRPVDERQRASSFLGYNAPWSGDPRY